MLGRLDRQRNFFDELLFDHMLPAEHPLLDIDRAVDFSFVEEETADRYSADQGRPSYPPEQLVRILFLAVWANLSDVQVCQQLRYNVLYRYFCRLGWKDAIPDDTTLVRFRQRLGEERWQRLLHRLVEQARAKGCLKGRWLVMDSSPVVAHAAARTRVQLLREGRQRLLQAVRQAAPPVAKELEALAEPVPDATYEDQDQLLQAEQERTEALLAAITSRQAAKAPAVRRVRKQVERVLKDERVASYADPEARWGHQRREKPFFGYKMHLATDETGFVLAATVTAGNASDLEGAPALVEQARVQGLRPRRLVADKAYDASGLRQDLVRQGIRPYIPQRTQRQRLPKQGFTYDQRRRQWICPEGHRSIGQSPHQRGGWLVYFSERACRVCPRAGSCLSRSQTRKVLYWHPGTEANRPRGLKRALRVRKVIERTFGEAKQWHGLGRSRYRGRERTAIQVLLTCLVLNAKKMACRFKDARGHRKGPRLPERAAA